MRRQGCSLLRRDGRHRLCGISSGRRVLEWGCETEAVALVEDARVLSAQKGWLVEAVAMAHRKGALCSGGVANRGCGIG